MATVGPSAVRWAWRGLVTVAVLAVCGFTLYWTQTKVDTMSARLAAMDLSLEALREQSVVTEAATPNSLDAGVAADSTPLSAEMVRLGRIVKCETKGNLVSVTYDPAQLFTGSDAVRLAASKGEAVTNGLYVFDPTQDLFTDDSPAKTAVILHQAVQSGADSSPTTITELAAALKDRGAKNGPPSTSGFASTRAIWSASSSAISTRHRNLARRHQANGFCAARGPCPDHLSRNPCFGPV